MAKIPHQHLKPISAQEAQEIANNLNAQDTEADDNLKKTFFSGLAKLALDFQDPKKTQQMLNTIVADKGLEHLLDEFILSSIDGLLASDALDIDYEKEIFSNMY